MCLIIDVNFATQLINNPQEADFNLIFEWLDNSGMIVIGGSLSAELYKINKVRRYIFALFQSGKALKVNDKQLLSEINELRRTGLCCSNDHHIIALARISGARTLCTFDGNLETDFCNGSIIYNPRGKIYHNNSHWKLLTHTSSCKTYLHSRQPQM